MKIKCLHGFYIFRNDYAGEISRFCSLTGLDIVPKDDYFTFAFLKDAPDYSFTGKTYLGLPALETYEGKPWEVMEENGFVYDVNAGSLKLIQLITKVVDIEQVGSVYVASGLLQAGSIAKNLKRVKNYSASFDLNDMKFRYNEIEYESI